MKVLMQNRVDLYEKPGGDLVQMEKTQHGLRQLGIDVDISTEIQPNLAGYDVVHLFNITRIHETAAQFAHARAHGVPVVISPIYHKVAEIERYERLGRVGNLARLNKVLRTTTQRETFKNILRLKDDRQRSAILSSLRRGFFQSQQYVLEQADAWVVLAVAEAEAITLDFGLENRYVVARNAVDDQFFTAQPDQFVAQYGLQDFVLCVSRIEDRKNQVALIQALQGMEVQLVFIGGENPHHASYVRHFRDLVKQHQSWVHYLGALPYTSLPSAYAAAAVHVLPSWFEVVSLTALEAAAAGCPEAVSNTGYIQEYLGETTTYIDPADPVAMTQSVARLLQRPRSRQSLDRQLYNWMKTAQDTLAIYQQVAR